MDNSKSDKQDWGYPSEMVSLFEYYGKPQGYELGTKVYKLIDNTIGGNDKGDGLTNYKSDLEIVNELISEYEQKAEE